MSVTTISASRFTVLCFVATGIPFGVVMGLTAGSAIVGIVCGTGFGAAMTAVIGGLHFALARVGTRVLGVHQTDQFVVTMQPNAVRAAAEAALRDVGVDRPRVEPSGDTVVLEGRTRMSWKSWGESVRVELGPRVGDATPVQVTSRPWWRTTIADYGKNLANVRAIRAAMDL